MDGFDSLLQERDTYMTAIRNGRRAIPVRKFLEPAAAQNKHIFSILSAVSQDEDCMMNIKKRGLIPVAADVATNIGLVASIMPTPNGFIIGASGIAIGSALRIINGLFKSPFDWKKPTKENSFWI